MMTHTTDRLTADEVETAVDYVRAHLNSLSADALEGGARPVEVHLREAELRDWVYRLEISPERAAEVLAAVAGRPEEPVVRVFLRSLDGREER